MAGDPDDEEQTVNSSTLAVDMMNGSVGWIRGSQRFCAQAIADGNNMIGWFNHSIKVVSLIELHKNVSVQLHQNLGFRGSGGVRATLHHCR